MNNVAYWIVCAILLLILLYVVFAVVD